MGPIEGVQPPMLVQPDGGMRMPQQMTGPQQIDPQVIQRLAALWGITDREAAMKLERERYGDLAQTPQSRGYQIGNMFVSSPGDAIGSALMRGMGNYKLGQLQREQGSLNKQKMLGHEAAMGLWLGRPFGM